MELRELIHIVLRYKHMVAAIIVACMALAALISTVRSQQYEASFSLIIRPKALEKTENFQFTDVLEASDRITRMSENWMQEQPWHVSTRRLGNQFIKISFDKVGEQEARERMDDIFTRSNTFLASLSPEQQFSAFEANVSDFSFEQKNPYWAASLLVGFLMGFLVAFFTALLRHYLHN